jgi:serine/threonine-protein kinase
MTLRRAADMPVDNHVRASTPKYRRQLTRDLDAIVRKAMAKAPSARYGSMDALITDLRAFLDGRPVSARRAGASYFVWRFAARHRLAVTATLGALVALTITMLAALHQSHVARAEADRANAVVSFLVGLFQVADPSVNRGERLNANQILEKGLERIDRDLASQPAQKASLQSVIGEVYAILGDYTRAKSALDPAIEALADPSIAADGADLAHALDWRAFITATEGDYEGALKSLDRAEKLLDGDSPREKDELATLHARRASALAHIGDYASARREYETAIDLRDELGQQNTQKTAGIHNNFGTMLRAINDLPRASEEFGKANAIFQRLEGDPERNFISVGTRTNLAAVLIDLGDLDHAEPLLVSASRFFNESMGAGSIGYANAENKLGEIDRLRRRYDAALAHYDTAERAFREALGPRHPRVASPIQNRGHAELEQQHDEAALAAFEEALGLLEALPRTRREVASALHGRGQALYRLGRYEDANRDLEAALEVWRNVLPASHPLVVYGLIDLGLARSALGDAFGAGKTWNEALERAPLAFADNPERLRMVREAIIDPSHAYLLQAGSYDE